MIPSNYRPISLLPIFGKIFEKIIFARLTDFINKFKIIYDKQYGFQKGKSTEYALVTRYSKLYLELFGEERKPLLCFP